MHITEPVRHRLHGADFDSFVSPSSGSRELCAWRTTIGPGQAGAEHTIDHEEVFLVLAGEPVIRLDGAAATPTSGEVVFAPAGSSVAVDNPGPDPVTMWVTTVVGLTATMAGGDPISPPWAR
ncbi:cupin domain-containing protein [Gordonia sp. NPDC003376]